MTSSYDGRIVIKAHGMTSSWIKQNVVLLQSCTDVLNAADAASCWLQLWTELCVAVFVGATASSCVIVASSRFFLFIQLFKSVYHIILAIMKFFLNSLATAAQI